MNPKTGHPGLSAVATLSAVVFVGLPGWAEGGETCVENQNGPDLCVAYNEGTPQLNQDFFVDFSDPANPSVSLRTGSVTWNVRSDDNGSPGDIGTINLNPIVGNENYGVSILGEGGTGPGAANVGNISLTAGNWSGGSSITNGVIDGDLTGDLTVVRTTGTTGLINLSISGDADGDITVGGELTSTGRILIDGLCAANIVIGRETESLSLIRAYDGLSAEGSIVVNNTRGNYDANGIISFGVATDPLPDVTFDGYILVKDDTSGNGGDLLT